MHNFKVKVSGDDKTSYESSIAIHLCQSKVLLANTSNEIRFFDDSQYTEYKHHALKIIQDRCSDVHCDKDGLQK